MKNLSSKIAAISLALLGAHLGYSALGSIGRAPSSFSSRADYLPEMRKQAAKNLEEYKANEAKNQEMHVARMRIFSKFKPVDRGDELDVDLTGNHKKSFFEEMFNKDLTGEMKARYQGSIAPIEAKINSPYRRANIFELQQYDQSRSAMANWTAKEVLDNKLKELLRGADKDSGAMQVISAVRSVTGGTPEEKPKEKEVSKKETQAEKIARVHRVETPADEVDEHIPTRLKTRFNVLKRYGNFNFSNPIVNTNLDLNLAAEDKLIVNINKEFRKLKMRSNAQYGLRKRILHLNVNKTITDKISLDIDSTRYTGQEKDVSGKKSLESAKVTYSLSF